jgi:hypothetical protein
LKRPIEKARELFFRAPFLWVALLVAALTADRVAPPERRPEYF